VAGTEAAVFSEVANVLLKQLGNILYGLLQGL